MPYYEIIYETGTRSLAPYESDEMMFEAVGAHHAKAVAGQVGGPSGHRAERVVKVEKYDSHPGDLNADQTMSADVMQKELAEIVKRHTEDGAVYIPHVVAEVRNLSNPHVEEADPHDSEYKMESVQTFTEGWE